MTNYKPIQRMLPKALQQRNFQREGCQQLDQCKSKLRNTILTEISISVVIGMHWATHKGRVKCYAKSTKVAIWPNEQSASVNSKGSHKCIT